MSLLLCYFPVIFLIKFNHRFYYYICYYHHTLSVACRGCWMPGANEVLGCPRIFSIRLPKFLTTFLVIYQNVSLFYISFHIRSLNAPPSAASCPSNDIFLFIV